MFCQKTPSRTDSRNERCFYDYRLHYYVKSKKNDELDIGKRMCEQFVRSRLKRLFGNIDRNVIFHLFPRPRVSSILSFEQVWVLFKICIASWDNIVKTRLIRYVKNSFQCAHCSRTLWNTWLKFYFFHSYVFRICRIFGHCLSPKMINITTFETVRLIVLKNRFTHNVFNSI